MNKNATWSLLFLLVACGSDDATPGADGGGAGGGNQGSATLTIGTQTWEFDNFRCAIGTEETRSEIYPFNTDSRGMHTSGARTQMQAEIEDDTGAGRLEGEGVIFTVYMNDIDDFENPSVSWRSTSYEDSVLVQSGLAAPSGGTTVTLSGRTVTASGMFDDLLTENDFTMTPGTLTGTCAP